MKNYCVAALAVLFSTLSFAEVGSVYGHYKSLSYDGCDYSELEEPEFLVGRKASAGIVRASGEHDFDGLRGQKLKLNDTRFGYVDGTTREYAAVTESCEKVSIQIPEDHAEFSRYFMPSNHDNNGYFSFADAQTEVGLVYVDDYEKLQMHSQEAQGSDVYFVPVSDTPKEAFRYNQPSEWVQLEHFKPYELEWVLWAPIYKNGLMQSQLGLIVVRDGMRYVVPFDRKSVRTVDPLRDSEVSKANAQLIRAGDIAFGMNINEVLLSLGEPDDVKKVDLSQDPVTLGVYEFNPRHKTVFPMGVTKERYSVPFSVRLQFKYDHFHNGYPLLFDEEGILRKDLQYPLPQSADKIIKTIIGQ
ncbi:hypothetical protein AB4254_08940 [Vibrio breoganii]